MNTLRARATMIRLTHLADVGLLSRGAWERACFIAGHVPTVQDWWTFIHRTLELFFSG